MCDVHRPTDDGLGLVLIGAVRYALGRGTHVVEDTCTQVLRWWPALTPRDRAVIGRDIHEAITGWPREHAAASPVIAEKLDTWERLAAWIDRQG